MPQLLNQFEIGSLRCSVVVSLIAQRPRGEGIPSSTLVVLTIPGPDHRYSPAVGTLAIEQAKQFLDYLKSCPDSIAKAAATSLRGDFHGTKKSIGCASLNILARSGRGMIGVSMRAKHRELTAFLTVDEVNLLILHLSAGLLKIPQMLADLLTHATKHKADFFGQTLTAARESAWLQRGRHPSLEYTVVDGDEPQLRWARGFGATREKAIEDALERIPPDSTVEDTTIVASKNERTISISGATFRDALIGLRKKYPEAHIVDSEQTQPPSNGALGLFKRRGEWSAKIQIPDTVAVQYREPYTVVGHWYQNG